MLKDGLGLVGARGAWRMTLVPNLGWDRNGTFGDLGAPGILAVVHGEFQGVVTAMRLASESRVLVLIGN